MPPRQLGDGDAADAVRPEPPRLPARGRTAGQERQARVAGTRRRTGRASPTAGVRHAVGDAPGRGRSRPASTDPGRRPGRPRRARDRRPREPGPAPQPVTLAREFDGVLGVLSTFGLRRPRGWALTEAGEMLARTFHECDLLVTAVPAAGAARRPRPGRRWPGSCRRSSTSTARPTTRRRPWFPSDDVKRPVAQHRRGQRGPARRSSAATASLSTARRSRRSSPSPTRGSRARASPRSSPTRSSPVATSSGR